MRIFLTGGTGRIGSVVRERLKGMGYEVLCLTRRGAEGCSVIKGDLLTFDLSILKDVDCVVHLAGSVMRSPEEMYTTNVLGTKRVVDAANDYGVETFVHMSSISVYGKRDNTDIREDTPLMPDTDYAKSKHQSEIVARRFRGRLVILRPGMAYGPNVREGFEEVVKKIGKGSMVILGRGDNHIPLVHVDDIAQAVVLAVARGDGVYNVGNERSQHLTQVELYRLVAGVLGVEPPKKHMDPRLAKILLRLRSILGGRANPEMVDMLATDRVINIERIRALGYKQSVDIREGVQKTVRSLIKRPGQDSNLRPSG